MKIAFTEAMLLFTMFACVALGIIVINFFVRITADRQTATIYDIPLYTPAFSVQYMDKPYSLSTGTSREHCPSLTFATGDSEGAVQKFYEKTLLHSDTILKRGWVGDGVYYPQTDSVRFYRKAAGIMQSAVVTTIRESKETQIMIYLCNLK